MQVDLLGQIKELRDQLHRDRKLCANSDLAQKYLDSAEASLNAVEDSWARRNPLEAIDEVLGEVEIGSDTATSEELRAMVADLHEWEAALGEIPTAHRNLPLYALAEKYLRTLKRNYVKLYRKNELETLTVTESGTVN